jgi:hypothetical protein
VDAPKPERQRLANLTPGPPSIDWPSPKKMTPADSRAARISATVLGNNSSPRSSLVMVLVDTPAASATSRTPRLRAARAIRDSHHRIRRPSVSQLVFTHTKITDLARGPLSSRAVDDLLGTEYGMQKEIVATPAADWSEFGAKVRLLFDELTTDPTTGWLDAIRESVRADIERLEAAAA